MPKSSKKKKEKVADFSVMYFFGHRRGTACPLILDQTESKVEARKREEATDECRRHDVQSAMYVFRYTGDSVRTTPLTLAPSYCAPVSEYNQR